jgi:hypothetical protein
VPISNQELARWIWNQRERRTAGRLSQECIRRLDRLGFHWERLERRTWEQRLAEVAEFRAKHGHCNIPINYRENRRLGIFVSTTRSQRKRSLLSAERIAKLDELGFMWRGQKNVTDDGLSKPWRTRFADLLRYKEVHGNCDVPAKWEEDEKLSNWVSQQRQEYNRGSLHVARVKLLEEAGFRWDGRRRSTNVS